MKKKLVISFLFAIFLVPVVVLFASCDKTPAKAVGLSLDMREVRLAYDVGESLDIEDLVVNLKYSDNSLEEISEFNIDDSAFDASRVGKYSITVTYDKYTKAFDVFVFDLSVECSNKIYVGQNLETIKPEISFTDEENNTSQVSHDYQIVELDTSTIGTKLMTVSYSNISATCEVEVVSKIDYIEDYLQRVEQNATNANINSCYNYVEGSQIQDEEEIAYKSTYFNSLDVEYLKILMSDVASDEVSHYIENFRFSDGSVITTSKNGFKDDYTTSTEIYGQPQIADVGDYYIDLLIKLRCAMYFQDEHGDSLLTGFSNFDYDIEINGNILTISSVYYNEIEDVGSEEITTVMTTAQIDISNNVLLYLYEEGFISILGEDLNIQDESTKTFRINYEYSVPKAPETLKVDWVDLCLSQNNNTFYISVSAPDGNGGYQQVSDYDMTYVDIVLGEQEVTITYEDYSVVIHVNVYDQEDYIDYLFDLLEENKENLTEYELVHLEEAKDYVYSDILGATLELKFSDGYVSIKRSAGGATTGKIVYIYFEDLKAIIIE